MGDPVLWYGYGDDKAGRGYRDPKREYDLLSGHGRRNQGKLFNGRKLLFQSSQKLKTNLQNQDVS